MPLHYDCDAMPGNFVEFHRWSRRDMNDALQLEGDDHLQLIQRKIAACHLDRIDDEPLTDPAQFAAEADNIDYVVWRWLSTAIGRVRYDLVELGEAAAASLLPTTDSGEAASQETND